MLCGGVVEIRYVLINHIVIGHQSFGFVRLWLSWHNLWTLPFPNKQIKAWLPLHDMSAWNKRLFNVATDALLCVPTDNTTRLTQDQTVFFKCVETLSAIDSKAIKAAGEKPMTHLQLWWWCRRTWDNKTHFKEVEKQSGKWKFLHRWFSQPEKLQEQKTTNASYRHISLNTLGNKMQKLSRKKLKNANRVEAAKCQDSEVFFTLQLKLCVVKFRGNGCTMSYVMKNWASHEGWRMEEKQDRHFRHNINDVKRSNGAWLGELFSSSTFN